MNSHPVVVIGAGLAGIMAAFAAQAEGARVLLLDRSDIGLGSNSAMAAGVFAGPTATYNPDDYIKDTIQIGSGLNDRLILEYIAREIGPALRKLQSLGLTVKEMDDHFVITSRQNKVPIGVPLVRQLAAGIRKLQHVQVATGFYTTGISSLPRGGLTISGFDRYGTEKQIFTPAAILATGGAGAIYSRNDNQKSAMGQGFLLAANAGLSLWDMEFVQFYPLVLDQPGLPAMMVYPPYPVEAQLIDQSGYDILKPHGLRNLNEACRKKRDSLSLLIYKKIRKGQVYMDLRKVPPDQWHHYPLNLLGRMKHNFMEKPVRISPGAHFFMGGIRTSLTGATSIPGLFACGEIVCGAHGANRRGGNALSECLVFGLTAGQNAARKALSCTLPPYSLPPPKTGQFEKVPASNSSHREIGRQLKEVAWDHAGVIRKRDSLSLGLDRLERIETATGLIVPQTVAELRRKMDLRSGQFTLRAVLSASVARKESRGAFYRSDFPSSDDVNWQKHSQLQLEKEKNRFHTNASFWTC